MPNLNYEKGRAAEYSAKRTLERVGYLVTRAAGSHGVFDLVAIGARDVLAVQCKRGQKPPSQSEWQGAVDANVMPGVIKMVVYFPEGRTDTKNVRVLYCNVDPLPALCPMLGWMAGMPPKQKVMRFPA